MQHPDILLQNFLGFEGGYYGECEGLFSCGLRPVNRRQAETMVCDQMLLYSNCKVGSFLVNKSVGVEIV